MKLIQYVVLSMVFCCAMKCSQKDIFYAVLQQQRESSEQKTDISLRVEKTINQVDQLDEQTYKKNPIYFMFCTRHQYPIPPSDEKQSKELRRLSQDELVAIRFGLDYHRYQNAFSILWQEKDGQVRQDLLLHYANQNGDFMCMLALAREYCAVKNYRQAALWHKVAVRKMLQSFFCVDSQPGEGFFVAQKCCTQSGLDVDALVESKKINEQYLVEIIKGWHDISPSVNEAIGSLSWLAQLYKKSEPSLDQCKQRMQAFLCLFEDNFPADNYMGKRVYFINMYVDKCVEPKDKKSTLNRLRQCTEICCCCKTMCADIVDTETRLVKKSLSVCSRCKLVEYCGKECQQKDWPIHKAVCKKSANKEKQGQKDKKDEKEKEQ